MRWREAAVVLALAGCGGPAAPHPLRYTGALAGCGLAAATLAQQGPAFTFTPGDGVLTIGGSIGADGSFQGTLNTQPAGKPAFVLQVRGRIAGESATVDYTTPRCHAHATLTLVHPALL